MPADGAYDLGRFNILLVEDSQYILSVLDDLLRYMGVGNVFKARDGVEAIELLKQSRDPYGGVGSRIDLIISDMVMALIDGLVLLRWVREGKESPDRFLPFIMMSGAADDENVQKARDQGVNEFLAKPFSAASVSQRILEVIDNPRQFIATRAYFGPDRHRKNENVAETERREMAEKDTNIVYSTDRVVRPKDPKDVYYFRLPNSLKEKAGGLGAKGRGVIPQNLLDEADQTLERKAVEFHDWAIEYLAMLSAYCVRAQ
jgi:CheY-like chemotaxis protein